MQKLRRGLKALVGMSGAMAAVAGAGQARGALTLTLSEAGFSPLTVTDSSNSGALSFFGTYGDFQTNFIAGLSNKLSTPTPAAATLQIQSINVKNTSAGGTTNTLTLTLSDDGYTFPAATGSTLSLDSAFGGSLSNATAGDSATFQSFVLSPSTTTGLQTYTAATTDPGTTSFSRNVVPVTFVRPAAYTLENVTTVSLSGASEQANLSGTTTASPAVPEPASAAAIALLGAGLLGRRRANRRR